MQLTNNADDQIRYFINLKEAPQSLKAKLQEALKVKASWDKVRQDIQAANQRDANDHGGSEALAREPA